MGGIEIRRGDRVFGDPGQKSQPPRAAVQRGETLRCARYRGTKPAPGIGEQSELLQRRVLGNRPEIRSVANSLHRRPGLLSHRCATSRWICEVRRQRTQKGAVVGVVGQIALKLADDGEQFANAFALCVVGVGSIVRRCQRVLQHPGRRRQRGVRGQEVEPPVPTLKANLLGDRNAGVGKRPPGRRRVGVFQRRRKT